MDRNYDVITFILLYPYFKKSRVAIFTDIIKIVTMIFKTIIKDPRKVKRIRNYISKPNLHLYILM